MSSIQNRQDPNSAAPASDPQRSDQSARESLSNPVSTSMPMGRELQQLRDVHPPAPVSAWPPAPGWWLLLVGGAVVLLLIARRMHRRRQRRAPFLAVLAELDRMATRMDPPAHTQEVAVLLRRMALLTHPAAAALPAEQLPEHLFGVHDEWLVKTLTERFAPTHPASQADTGADVLQRLRVIIEHAMRSTK